MVNFNQTFAGSDVFLKRGKMKNRLASIFCCEVEILKKENADYVA